MRPILILFLVTVFRVTEAAQIEINVIDQFSRSVPDAVVQFANKSIPSDKMYDQVFSVSQKSEWFNPILKVIPRGAKLKFKNLDPIGHIVRTPEFGRYGLQGDRTQFFKHLSINSETDEIQFNRPGFVEYFCEIHSFMRGVIYVAESTVYSKTDKRGLAKFDVEPGEHLIKVWSAEILAQKEQEFLINVNEAKEIYELKIIVGF